MIILLSVLILLVILVNGWTDAPNAIASCVSTRSMSPRGALILASVCNFVGAVGMAIISPKVANTVFNIVDFGEDTNGALLALCSGLLAVVLWSTVAWIFGLPTSESHALISGITGAALANKMSIDAINFDEWKLVLLGLLATTIPAFVLGAVFYKLLISLLCHLPRKIVMKYFMRAQCIGAASSALLHGAQDSQKFIGIYMLGLSLKLGGKSIESIPIPIILVCAAVMTLGTALGGGRIIKKVGCDMTRLDAVGGSASDASSSIVLLICSFLGIPASTTHSKACAIMGTGICKKRGLDLHVVLEVFGAWCLTFPICMGLGFLLSFIMSLCF